MTSLQKDGESRSSPRIAGVRSVALRDYRNYRSLEVDLGEGFNVIAGPNAQGKTNFLEALFLLSTTRLLRGQRDAEAIREGADRAYVSATLIDSNTQLGMEIPRGVRKRATLNSLGLPRASDLIGRLPTVCVSTEDMAIVRGEPTERRLFLDLELSGLYPAYLRHLTLYKRALEQRNALLKDSREWMKPAETFEVWEVQIAHHGAAIREVRKRYLLGLTPHVQETHGNMGHGEKVSLEYMQKDQAEDERTMMAALEAARGSDVARGATTVGPHRDDLLMTIQGREARLYGSQGQQRTSVISLKLGTLSMAEQELGLTPLLLLDDILSDLDETRRALLVELVLSRAGQAVLTCTEASAAGPKILEKAEIYEVSEGTLTRR